MSEQAPDSTCCATTTASITAPSAPPDLLIHRSPSTVAFAGGDPPIVDRLPTFMTRVGIDRSPIDLTDPTDVRWLLACVWPDSGRLERTAASIALAQQSPPRVIAADANAALPDLLTGLPPGAPAVIVTTWAFAYFSLEDRQEFIALLDRASLQREIAWLSAEGPGTVEPLSVAVGGASRSFRRRHTRRGAVHRRGPSGRVPRLRRRPWRLDRLASRLSLVLLDKTVDRTDVIGIESNRLGFPAPRHAPPQAVPAPQRNPGALA